MAMMSYKPFSFRAKYYVLIANFWAIAVLMLWPVRAVAWEHTLKWNIGDTFYIHNNYLSRSGDGLDFNADSRYNLFSLTPELLLSQGKQASLYVRCDLEWQYELYSSSETEYSETSLETILTSAYLSLKGENVQTLIGVQPIQFGNGLITMDDGLALSMTAGDKQWSINGLAGRVLTGSPMAGLTLHYQPTIFDHLSLFGVWFRDNRDAFAGTVDDSYQFLDLSSEGDVGWIGTSVELLLDRFLISATAAYEFGQATFRHRFGETEKNIAAYLTDLAVSSNLNQVFSLELFLFTASGDSDFNDETLGCFITPLPYNPRTLIFFDPAWLDNDPTESMIFGGSTFYGVVAPGLTLTAAPTDRWLLTVTGALFYPQQAPQDDRDFYGREVDLNISYNLQSRTDLYLEAGRFTYGSFFENQSNHSLDAAVHFAVGGRISF